MLKRLWGYSNKVFDLAVLLAGLSNRGFSQRYNEPLITSVLLVGMLLRIRSLHALVLSIRSNQRTWRKWCAGSDLPSASTLSRGLGKSDVESLRHISGDIAHRLRRNKVLNTGEHSSGLMVAAVDGHETISSRKRCCSQCQKRIKKAGGKEVIEYYHRYVVCQLVLGSVPAILDIEPIGPGEGEQTASKRLIKRVLKERSRMVDVFVFDALYLDSKLLNMLNEANKYWVVVLKQEKREVYEEIDRLLPKAKKQVFVDGGKHVTLWDLPELVCWDGLKHAFRGVVSEEKKLVWEKDKSGKKHQIEEISHWRWLTNMPAVYPAKIIYCFGHGRWDIENRGFNELVNQCHFDHAFHHHPNALLAMLWIISLAFTLSYTFFLRNLKPQFRKIIGTRQQLAEQLKLSLAENKDLILLSLSP